MQQLHLVGFTTDLQGLIFSARRGAKSGSFVVQLDQKLVETIAEAREPGAHAWRRQVLHDPVVAVNAGALAHLGHQEIGHRRQSRLHHRTLSGYAAALVPGVRYRCTACGNLTRFDVTTTRRTRAFHHYSLGGELSVEDEEVLHEDIEEVSCRWCGSGGAVQVVEGPVQG